MSFARYALALLLLMFLPAIACAQGNEDVIYGRPLHVRHFAGRVVDQTGMTVDYATVELRNPKDHRVLASTFADGTGFFFFDDKKYGKTIEIRVFKKDFSVSQYTVMRRPFGDGNMRLVLHVGT
jgi:hypothetical protein